MLEPQVEVVGVIEQIADESSCLDFAAAFSLSLEPP